MAAIAGVGVEPFDRIADELLDCRDDGCERVSMVWIAGQRLQMDDELAAFAALRSRRHAHLDTNLIRLVRLAFADAFHFRGVQAVLISP